MLYISFPNIFIIFNKLQITNNQIVIAKKKHKIQTIKPFIELLINFSDKEKRDFSKFIHSHYFNTDQYVIKLYTAIEPYLLKKEDYNQFAIHQIYLDVFGATQSSNTLNKKERKLYDTKMSVLFRLAKKFLVIDEINASSPFYKNILYKKLLKKQHYKITEKQLTKDKKLLGKSTTMSSDYHEHSFHLELGYFHFLSRSKRILNIDNISELNYQLDTYYLLHKLKVYTMALSLAKISDKKNFDDFDWNISSKLLNKEIYTNHPLIKIYLKIQELIAKENEKTYHQIIDLLKESEPHLSRPYLHFFYTEIQNFCIRKIINKNLIFNQYLYQLTKYLDSKNLLIEDGKMDITKLKNSVGLACRFKDFDWAKKLVSNYIDIINHEDRSSVNHFNLGLIALYEKNYSEAIHHLIRVRKVRIDYDINCRMLMIKAHYELDKEYDERTMTIFRNTEQFVIKHKYLSTKHKKSYRNFTRLVINLYKLRHKIGKITKDKLIAKMEKSDKISDENWLLEKLEEINR